MSSPKGALTVAEGHPAFITDADIIFNNERDKKDFVLRTTRDDIGIWKTKHNVSMSPFKTSNGGLQKWVARIDKDYWVFGIDATKADDIFAAVKIGMNCYDARASDLIKDVYVKNLNIENEAQIDKTLLVKEKNYTKMYARLFFKQQNCSAFRDI